jgi:3-deoxy-D-manno-octulosonic-acid transferase
MRWLLDALYVLLLLLLLPRVAVSAFRDGKYRQGWSAKLWGRVSRRADRRPCVWLHAVSLGEVNLLGTVVRRLEQELPELAIYITTTTRTGYDAAKSRFAQHTVSYCPLDFSWAVDEALRRIRPSLLVLAELELWPNLIRGAQQAGVPVALINGRLSEGSFRGYRRASFFFRHVLRRMSLIGVQTEVYRERFVALGADARIVSVTGSLKFDGAETDPENPGTQALRRRAGLEPQAPVWLAGSTFPPEERCVLEAFTEVNQEDPELRLILVPRHPERFDEVARMIAATGHPWLRRSQLPAAGAEPIPAWRILLVDTVGELASWWGVASIGYVGGSMGARGGQSMIEPAGYGVAISFGPNTENFRDVTRQMLESDAAVVVRNSAEMASFVRACRQDEGVARERGQRARRMVLDNAGATSRTLEQLRQFLPEPTVDATPDSNRPPAAAEDSSGRTALASSEPRRVDPVVAVGGQAVRSKLPSDGSAARPLL